MSKLEGFVRAIKEVNEISDSFKKREFSIQDTNEKYPQYIKFELSQDKVDLIDNFAVDQKVIVSYNLKGREWTNKEGEVQTFNSLEAWKIEAND